VIRIGLLFSLFSLSCVSQAKQAVAPEPDGTGTLSCREIVEQCDSQCGDPFCLQRCSGQGHAEGASQHQALIDCGQRNSCTDQDCMQANCPGEIQTCMGPEAAPAADDPEQEAAEGQPQEPPQPAAPPTP
jgi:hypothetical protein